VFAGAFCFGSQNSTVEVGRGSKFGLSTRHSSLRAPIRVCSRYCDRQRIVSRAAAFVGRSWSSDQYQRFRVDVSVGSCASVGRIKFVGARARLESSLTDAAGLTRPRHSRRPRVDLCLKCESKWRDHPSTMPAQRRLAGKSRACPCGSDEAMSHATPQSGG